MSHNMKVLSLAVGAGLVSLMTHSSYAQTGSGSAGNLALEEVLVTAQRKSESLQEVPISVNAVSGELMANLGLKTSVDLPQVVPALTFITTGPAGTPFLRGVGSNAGNPNDEPSVATYVDGVYIASPSGSLQYFNNLERVEVLKGPQGTLFGRNTTGGVIHYVTKDPSSDPELNLSLGYGNYDTWEGGVYASAGLTDNLAADIAFQAYDQGEGWGELTTTGEEIRADQYSSARTKWVFTPTDRLTLKLAADYSDYDTSMLIYTMPKGVPGIDGLPPAKDFYDSRSLITYKNHGAPGVDIEQVGGSLHLMYDMNDLRFVSITAYRETEGDYWPEADATPLPAVEGYLPRSVDTWSQEFQLMSTGDSWLDWVAGVYLYDNEAGYDKVEFSGLAFSQPPFSGIGSFESVSQQKTESWSAYLQGTAEIFTNTDLTLGIRYTDEEQSVEWSVFGTPVPSPDDKGYDDSTWRVALNHSLNDDIMIYASMNRGIKGGGFDLLSPGADGFDPEELDAWEVGLKSELLNRTLRFNAAYFYYDFQNIQVQIIPAGTQGIVQTTNAAAATIQGLDIDFQYLVTENLTLSGGAAWMDGEYDDFKDTVSYPRSPREGFPESIDASGNDTIRTPDFTGNLTAEYRIRSGMGDFPATLTVSHNSGFYFGADNRLEQEEYTLVNATFGWRSSDDKYGVTLWGRNLTDEEYWTQGVPSGLGDLVAPAAPMTYGVRFDVSFL